MHCLRDSQHFMDKTISSPLLMTAHSDRHSLSLQTLPGIFLCFELSLSKSGNGVGYWHIPRTLCYPLKQLFPRPRNIILLHRDLSFISDCVETVLSVAFKFVIIFMTTIKTLPLFGCFLTVFKLYTISPSLALPTDELLK